MEVPDTGATVRANAIDDTGQILGIVPSQQPIGLAVWSPSGELRVARPAQLDEQWSLTPIGFDNGVVRFWAQKMDGDEAMVGRWDARNDTYELTSSDGTYPSPTDNGWELKLEGDKYYVEGGGSRVELTKPADTGGNASNYNLNHDGRTVVTSLHLREQGHVAAVMWRCR